MASGFVSIDIGESPYWQYIVKVETFPVVRAKRMYTFDHGGQKAIKYITFDLRLIYVSLKSTLTWLQITFLLTYANKMVNVFLLLS